MLKLFYLFLTKSLSGSYKKQTNLKSKLLFLNQLKFKPRPIFGLNSFSLILVFLLFATSCGTTEPPPPPPDETKPTLTLELDDVSCTEAWLQLTTKDLELPAELTLKQYNPTGDSVAQVFNLSSLDTILYIDSLLPNQAYNYQAVLNTDTTIKSEKVTAQTLEPTSHNFTWQTWEFGQHSSSVLYDVAIIDENNIWAVGAIYMNDSLGNPDPNAYNAVHWDGNEWSLKRIYTFSTCNAVDYAPLKAIWAFSDTSLVVTSGGSIGWYNGITNRPDCSIRPLLTGAINKIWGSSSNDLYVVGNDGNIAHFTSTQFVNTWTKIESGTTSNINDIWGEVDQVTGERKILCAVSNISGGGEQKIIQINSDNTIDTLKWSMNRRIQSIWFKGKHIIYTSGGGVFFQSEKDKWIEQTELPLYYTDKIRGTDYNDAITVGAFGFAAHYNGISWQVLNGIPAADVLGSISIKNNLIATTGFYNSKAIIIIGNHF